MTGDGQRDELAEEMAKLRWQCRRGMKEIEVLINPFFEQHYATLDEHQKKDFAELLTANDAELYAWFMGHEQPSNTRMTTMIDTIQSALQPKV